MDTVTAAMAYCRNEVQPTGSPLFPGAFGLCGSTFYLSKRRIYRSIYQIGPLHTIEPMVMSPSGSKRLACLVRRRLRFRTYRIHFARRLNLQPASRDMISHQG